MRVLLLHDRYRLAGGEDAVVRAEEALLAGRGHAVRLLEVSNHVIGGLASRLRAGLRATWSIAARRAVAAEVARFRPDVVHVHNFFPLLSPSVYGPARRAGAAVVQTLHNYRLACPGAALFRQGAPCEDCLGRAVPWPALAHGCYRGSRAQTAAVVAMLVAHRALGTWARAVDLFLAPTEFVRAKLVAAGLAPERVDVKPHFVPVDPGAGDGRGGYALAVGRLAEEKGLRTLLAAWARLPSPLPLRIVGDGPLRDAASSAAAADPRITWLGAAAPDEVRAQMRGASLLVVPSTWYETFGLVVIEAFAAGLPVVAAGHGALAELVAHGRTGLLVPPGDPGALAAAIEGLVRHPERLAPLRRAARAEYEARYGADGNHALLMRSYARARDQARARRGAAPLAAREEERPWSA